uniref:Transposase n=1 Tax=Acrobeloides nanus TaxID=290746 RepID=A0A914CAH9_9BILA
MSCMIKEGLNPKFQMIMIDYGEGQVNDYKYGCFYQRFIDKDSWPGYSPDLNPCDYRLWAWMKQRVYEGSMPNTLEELRRRILQAWDDLPTDLIQEWLREFPARLKKTIDNKGVQIQQYFNKI